MHGNFKALFRHLCTSMYVTRSRRLGNCHSSRKKTAPVDLTIGGVTEQHQYEEEVCGCFNCNTLSSANYS